MKSTTVDVFGHLPHDHRQILLATISLAEDGSHTLEVACPIAWDLLPYCTPFMLGLDGKDFRFNPLHPSRGGEVFESMMKGMFTREEMQVADAVTTIVVDMANETYDSKLKDVSEKEFDLLRDRLHETYPMIDVVEPGAPF